MYSFGIVALEIATGKKSVDPGTGKSDEGLVEYGILMKGENFFLLLMRN